ncbi:hypothetical protein L3Q82_003792 [Scortum barcoo]|uniref:Uncharacterized protein n=1 Tax=Scortum barcoo TaxID=214431 RepID=A0ACB8X570_9TELE|nr:hypothetical protein L3Q82_003792 [Scortum barcoo]
MLFYPQRPSRFSQISKLRLDSTVKPLLKACDAAYRLGDKLAYSIARKELKKGIKLAKAAVPVTGETPVEYWLRLNKAVDIAEEGLKRLGRQMENPCQEATMMFVKYCPDPALAAVLKFKAPDKWTTSEIQERIDHYQIERKEQVQGMLDSGSMACTLSEQAEQKMLGENALSEPIPLTQEIVLVGCGGTLSKPKCMYEVEMKLYGESCMVPVLVVPGQRDELIVGTNVIRYLMYQLKITSDYWRLVSSGNLLPECEQFLDLMANTSLVEGRGAPGEDRDGEAPAVNHPTDKTRTSCLGYKLPKNAPMSLGSTVIVEPTSSKSMPRNIMVGRIITPLWGDGWVPMKVTNLLDKPITLKRNSKLADVSPCLAVEDFEIFQGTSQPEKDKQEKKYDNAEPAELKQRLQRVGLADIDIEKCHADQVGKEKLVELLEQYNDIFSKHALDCGEAKDFVHRIRLTDEKPFRLPYRRVPPVHYQKLRQVLSEMEEQEIIRKSVSEYASPLVLVWKKDGSLRLCTDFRWLNARTLKDTHPLPHQSDCLAALGGNTYFSTMDLTSGFYNIPMAEEDKKYTAFTTPMGLYEYNRMPQGLCNSPASFMRMMLSIFGDLNFSHLLCYLDDLLVFAATQEEALKRLEVVFQRLRLHNLKLSPKKCHLMRSSVRFLGHVIDGNGVAVDPAKVEVITKMSKTDLMEEDGCTPSAKRIKSFLRNGVLLSTLHR